MLLPDGESQKTSALREEVEEKSAGRRANKQGLEFFMIETMKVPQQSSWQHGMSMPSSLVSYNKDADGVDVSPSQQDRVIVDFVLESSFGDDNSHMMDDFDHEDIRREIMKTFL